jgi:RNA polymerase sigma-70 factor (ECF subfamily)
MAHATVDETPIRAAFDRGDLRTAATLALEYYGGEILSFLGAYLRSDEDAHEVFANFAENLWKGLPGFEWRNTLRAWAYTLARHAAIRHRTAAHRKPGRNIPLSRAAEMSNIVDDIRSRTAMHLRTETKSKMRELRERLPADDQTLIILRVDRNMSWAELAVVLGETAEGDADTKKVEARLRKRFQTVKDRLRDMAREAGLMDEG